jgi:hypothetical protein
MAQTPDFLHSKIGNVTCRNSAISTLPIVHPQRHYGAYRDKRGDHEGSHGRSRRQTTIGIPLKVTDRRNLTACAAIDTRRREWKTVRPSIVMTVRKLL